MSSIILPEQSSHWYSQDGAPQHGATLRDARKLNLLPSPTTILSTTVKSAGLETWKQEQLLISAFSLPREPGEDDNDFAKRVVADSKVATKSAAELGTRVHDGVESILTGKPYDKSIPQLVVFEEWAKDNIDSHEWTERVQVNLDVAVAGRADALVTFKGNAAEVAGSDPVLVDWKTQKMKINRKGAYVPAYYDKWILQLAFYSYCEMVPPPCVSVVINTMEAQPPLLKLWTNEERDAAWAAFQNAAELWFYLKNYKPKIEELSCL